MSTSSSAEATLGGAWATEWFAGRQVVVTGGTSGIGAAIARGFADAGARVLATGLTAMEITAAERLTPDGVTFRQLDVRDAEAVGAMMRGLDRLHVLVNCAGVSGGRRSCVRRSSTR